MEEKFKKLYTLKEEPALAIFNELESLNEGVQTLIEATESNKVEMPEMPEMPTEMTVKIAGLSTITLKGDKGDRGEKGEKGDKGERGADGKDGKDGETPFIDTEEIIAKASEIAQSNIEPLIPSIEDIKKDIPKLGEEIRNSLELLSGENRLDKKAIAGLDDYDEVKKKALEKQPVQYIGGGSGFSSPLTSKGDLFTYNSQNARLGVGEDGQVLVADSSESTGLKWQDPSFLANVTYMFSGTASGVGSYYKMPALGTYVEAAEASIVTAGVSTTPTLIASFITESGSPGVTTLAQGTYHFHLETEKTAGSNNYYVYATLYKRTAGGTETLLLTSDNSTESAVNTRIQRDVDGLLAASETLGVTDRLVVKWYAVMLSSTATITTYFDNNTEARMEMPPVVVDASNFVRKSGDTMSGDLNMGDNDITNVATIEIGSGATDTTLSRLSAGVLGVEGIEVPTISSTSTLSNKTIGNTNTVTLKDTLFTLQDDADTTKQAKFQLSGITTGTTCTYTLPNTSATIVVNYTNQTLFGQMTFSANNNSFGTGTGTGTQSFASGATVNGSTKTVNIATGGASGSTTAITIGSSTSGATTTTTLYGTFGVGAPETLSVHGTPFSPRISANSDTYTLLGTQTHSDTAATTPIIYGFRSRGTSASPTVVQTGDMVRLDIAAAYDGTDYEQLGYTAWEVDGTPGSNDMPGRFIVAVTPDGGFTPAEALRVSNDKSTTLSGTLAMGSNSITLTGSIASTGSRVTKGWFTDIESTNMPTVGGTAILTSLTAPQFTTVELGHASDTSLSRVSAGVIAVEGVTIPTISSTNTLTNKRVTKRVGSTTSSATPTINTDDVDCYKITALATAITSFTTNLSGTPTDFQELTIRIKDDGTARAITWGASFTNHGAILPTTTTVSKVLTTKFIYDSVAAKWGCVAAVEEA